MTRASLDILTLCFACLISIVLAGVYAPAQLLVLVPVLGLGCWMVLRMRQASHATTEAIEKMHRRLDTVVDTGAAACKLATNHFAATLVKLDQIHATRPVLTRHPAADTDQQGE